MVRWRALTAAAAGVCLAVVPGTAGWADAVRDTQWQLGFLDIERVHTIGQGDGVVVAVIDSGVDGTHPDLAGSVMQGYDFGLTGRNGWADLDGHGTAMAGLIAAHGRTLGIAPKAQILPVLVGITDMTADDEGIRWAVDHGAKVICLAGGGQSSDRIVTATRYALDHDVVLVAAAGNRPKATGVEYPAALPGVVAAAGVDQNGNHAENSVTGPEVVLAAPAVKVGSITRKNGYITSSGTSDATAIIAGVAALVRAKYPQLPAAEVVHRMTATAIDKGAPGRDPEYGYGIVNPYAALTADVAPAASPSPSGTAAGSDGGGRGVSPAVIAAAATVGGLVLVVAIVAGLLVRRRRREQRYRYP